ncbi:hypothetical protein B0H17DRAFT_1125561 [Mycena rosella]|uniref:Uncharacterized protein n=1 Tax=Mycena rosella TaxID=1033263 RepID=A0AAD7M9K0_MYCRO|nr:hypothetical protein B0H17DRAFT_1125561 [Mycena rosella]
MSSTFCNVPVSAVFDSNVSYSTVCLEWVINSGLHTWNSQASGLLSLPANAGFISMYLNNIPVAASLPSDLVLGLDWLQFVCNFTSVNIILHLSSGPLELRRSLSVTPVLRGGINVEPSSSSSVSWGGSGVVLTPSSTSLTQDVDAVAACTLAALPPRTRGVLNPNDNDVINVELPMNGSVPNDVPALSVYSPDHDFFVRLNAHEKTAVHMSKRESGETMKSANTLRTEFLVHHCTDVCLILRSEAAVAGLHPDSLSPGEFQECALILDLRSESESKKRKAPSQLGNTSKIPHPSLSSAPDVCFPIVLTQSEKDQIVHEFREVTNNASLKRAVAELRVIARQPRIEPFDNSSLENFQKSSRISHFWKSNVSLGPELQDVYTNSH